MRPLILLTAAVFFGAAPVAVSAVEPSVNEKEMEYDKDYSECMEQAEQAEGDSPINAEDIFYKCMAGRGYDVGEPDAPAESPKEPL